MSLEDFKRKDPQWTAVANGYSNRPYDEREAADYLTNCYKYRKPITLRGFASRFNWSTSKASRFLKQTGVKIVYLKEKTMGKNAPGCLVLLPTKELDPKKANLLLIIHNHYYFIDLD
ncbi:MAG: hypothetical protein U9O91_01330 [Candidatus Caldatribacteriota bacterium]|nr:hypothetical protein [Candidatus Caldatribacteriota bacterium]